MINILCDYLYHFWLFILSFTPQTHRPLWSNQPSARCPINYQVLPVLPLKSPCVHSLLLTPSVTMLIQSYAIYPWTCSFQAVACLPANTLIQSMLTPKWSFQHEHLYHSPTQHISMSDPGSKSFSGLHVSAHPHSFIPPLSLWANLLDFSSLLPLSPTPIFNAKTFVDVVSFCLQVLPLFFLPVFAW